MKSANPSSKVITTVFSRCLDHRLDEQRRVLGDRERPVSLVVEVGHVLGEHRRRGDPAVLLGARALGDRVVEEHGQDGVSGHHAHTRFAKLDLDEIDVRCLDRGWLDPDHGRGRAGTLVEAGVPAAEQVQGRPDDHAEPLAAHEHRGCVFGQSLVLGRARAQRVPRRPGGPGQHVEDATGFVDDGLGQVRGEPRSVPEGLPAQRLERPVVLVVDDRARLVHDRVACRDHVEERGEVVAALGLGPGTERGLEAAQGEEDVGAERHVGARTERPGRVREERVRRALARVEDARLEALVEPGVLLDPVLGRGLELEREDHPGDAADVGSRARTADEELREPARVDDDVVVGERHERGGDVLEAGVVRPGEPRPVLADVAEASVLRCQGVHQLGGVATDRRVVDHDDLGGRGVEAPQRVEAAGEALGPVAGRHDDRGARMVPATVHRGDRERPRGRPGHVDAERPADLAGERGRGDAVGPSGTRSTPIGAPWSRTSTTARP